MRKMRKIKIVGARSIETKAMRLCCDLRDDQAAQLLSDVADLVQR